jgi:hypothetical protein
MLAFWLNGFKIRKYFHPESAIWGFRQYCSFPQMLKNAALFFINI